MRTNIFMSLLATVVLGMLWGCEEKQITSVSEKQLEKNNIVVYVTRKIGKQNPSCQEKLTIQTVVGQTAYASNQKRVPVVTSLRQTNSGVTQNVVSYEDAGIELNLLIHRIEGNVALINIALESADLQTSKTALISPNGPKVPMILRFKGKTTVRCPIGEETVVFSSADADTTDKDSAKGDDAAWILSICPEFKEVSSK